MVTTATLLQIAEGLGTLLGLAYAVLAARRNRLCWVAGAASSALVAWVSALNALPMQAGLQTFYVAMSAYGWWSWSRHANAGGVPVGTWPVSWHLGAAVCMVVLSLASAQWLAEHTQAAWPRLDSLTTWFSLLATLLVARARLESWLYWIAIDGALVFVFYKQDVPGFALLNAVFMVIAVAGFILWRRKLGAPQ